LARLAGSSRLLRALNERTSMALLLERGQLTRGELRELTGLSKPTASEVLRRLQDAGLAVVAGRTSGGPGPNAEIYATNPDVAHHVGVSVRDTGRRGRLNVVAALADVTGAVRARTETMVDFGSRPTVDAVADVINGLVTEAKVPVAGLRHIQLGVPGSYDPQTDTIRYVDVPGWSAPGLLGRIREQMGTAVDVENDVKLIAIAERAHGVAAGASAFTLLWFGDEGLGLATDLGGTLLQGSRGSAGEIGYMPIGLPRPDGERANFTTVACGRAIVELAERHGVQASTAAAAVEAAVDGEHEGLLAELAERITVGIAAVVAVLDPPLVVLAGEVGRAGGDVLAGAVARAIGVVSPLDTDVAPSGLAGDDPVLLGALRAGLIATREQLLDGLVPSTTPERSPA
jgi:predicted NBD/HSP70 family sugar kinase